MVWVYQYSISYFHHTLSKPSRFIISLRWLIGHFVNSIFVVLVVRLFLLPTRNIQLITRGLTHLTAHVLHVLFEVPTVPDAEGVHGAALASRGHVSVHTHISRVCQHPLRWRTPRRPWGSVLKSAHHGNGNEEEWMLSNTFIFPPEPSFLHANRF